MTDTPDPRQRRTSNVRPIRPDIDPDAGLLDAADRRWSYALRRTLDRVATGATPSLAAEEEAMLLVTWIADHVLDATSRAGREELLRLLVWAYSDLLFFASPERDR